MVPLIERIAIIGGAWPFRTIHKPSLVNRRHAVIARDGNGLTIEDLGSLNGTFLNRKRIESSPLSDGDELQVGKYRLSFFG